MKINFDNIDYYEWGDLYYLKYNLDNILDAFQLLNNNLKKSNNESLIEFKSNIDKTLSKLEEDERSSYYIQVISIEEDVFDKLIFWENYAVALTLFSILETQLKKLCELIKFRFKDFSKIKSMANIEDYWGYITEEFKIKIDPIDCKYDIILIHKDIRNIIAHHEGYLNDFYLKKAEHIKDINVEISIENRLILSNEYYILMDKNIRIFFKRILQAIDEKYIQLTEN